MKLINEDERLLSSNLCEHLRCLLSKSKRLDKKPLRKGNRMRMTVYVPFERFGTVKEFDYIYSYLIICSIDDVCNGAVFIERIVNLRLCSAFVNDNKERLTEVQLE